MGTRALRRSRPVVAQTAILFRKLRPVTRELPATLPPVSDALRVGTPVLRRSVDLSGRLRTTSLALRDLVRDPNTQRSLGNLRTSVALLKPTLNFVAPYQTVCNYANYFFHPLGEHQSQPAPGGNAQQQLVRTVNLAQPNSLGFTYSSRPWDLQPGQSAHGATFDGMPAGRPMAPPYQPAIDAAGNADCQNGQTGFPAFRLIEDFVRKNGAAGTGDPNDIVTGTLPDGTAGGRELGGRQEQLPGPGRRHLQVARAGHRQPGGRAVRRGQKQRLSQLRRRPAGARGRGRGQHDRLVPDQPVRGEPHASGPSSPRCRTWPRARRCGSPAWRWARSPRSSRARAAARA